MSTQDIEFLSLLSWETCFIFIYKLENFTAHYK